jgi:hypothetical protein
MALRIVIDSAVLRGSAQDGFLQLVASVYSPTGEEYRVYAPSKATGKALAWADYFVVHQQSSDGRGENVVEDGRKFAIIGQVKEELEKRELDEDIWRSTNSQGRYCAAQICFGGHVRSADGTDFNSDEHCPQCGKQCIERCPKCKASIRGRVAHGGPDYVLPSYCHKCGHPYPWMEDRLQTAKELLYHDDKLTIDDKEKLWGLLQHVMSDPKSDTAPAKKKLFEIGLGKAVPATREFFLDLMAKLGAEMLKPKA